MDIVFKHGPWHAFFEGESDQHKVRLLFDQQSTILSIVSDVAGTENPGLVLEWVRVFATNKNPSILMEKAGFDCLEIAKKEEGQMHWFILLRSQPAYAPLDQQKIDREMEEAYFSLHGNEKKLSEIARTLSVGLWPLAQSEETTKSAFFGSPLSYPMLTHRVVQEKARGEKPVEFASQRMVSQGEFLIGIDKQKQAVREPFGLFRRTLIEGGELPDRLHTMHVMMESALLSSIAVVVFDTEKFFDGIQNPNPNRQELESTGLKIEPVGFPATNFSMPEKIRINISVLDVESVLELFRAGKTPAIQVLQEILSRNQAASLTQLIEAIKVQPPIGEASTYQLKKAIRIALLIEKTYPGFFNGPNDIPSIAKSWGSGLGRAGMIELSHRDKRAKTILFHALLRELIAYFRKQEENRPVKAMIFLPELNFLFPREKRWKIQEILEKDLQEASAVGIGSVISTEKEVEISDTIVTSSVTQISIVNEDDIAVRLENRKPYRVRLRPSLSTCTEKAIEPVIAPSPKDFETREKFRKTVQPVKL